ncbi:MAG: xanthine dehydrogenase family protein molybdopterin-binding subunit [SAR202 cluster bacterium]|nr:xanthine dehydrogenase family protein molybdopterin-binding subunit [SAR202 cluster bacterium]|tara:strand:+ start:1694 stop:3973 length:2280 start_codon:yes stop_codon:yes gene_type:complete
MATTTTVEQKTTEKVIGTRPIRHDGVDKVTGRAIYGADINLPKMLHVKILRSPHAHARIVSIDTKQALDIPGVKAVITGEDLPEPPSQMQNLGEGAANLRFLSDNAMARTKALYKGHAVAAVAATELYIAEEALSAIKVTWEILPAVLDTESAMAEGAPLVHDDLPQRPMEGDQAPPPNVARYFRFNIGDTQQAFEESDTVVEREFRTQMVHQGYIEPQTATALWKEDESLTIWCSSQGHFNVRDQTSNILQIPVSSIKVIPLEIGGGFGGKIGSTIYPVISLLSKKAGVPVKYSMTRAEVFEGTGPGSGTHMRVKIGAMKTGKITAVDVSLSYEAGAYPGSSVASGCQNMFSPYVIENAFIEGFDVIVNKPKTAAYRAPGTPQAAYAGESIIDEVAESIGMDPIDFRLLNVAEEDDSRVDGTKHRVIGAKETLEAIKNHPHYKSPLNGPNQGRGVAIGYWGNAGMTSSCSLIVNGDGTVNLVEGSVDIGGTRTAIAMHAAEVLGIPAEDIHPVVADTESVGMTSITAGSRTAFASGWAAYEAAQGVLKELIERAATVFETTPDQVVHEDGTFRSVSDNDKKLTFKELAGRLQRVGGPVIGQATITPRGVGTAFGADIVDVEVDPETGKVQVLRVTAAQDVGRAIHPSYVEGQIQGGVAQGIGWALNEEYVFNDEGVMQNPGFLDYRMPTSLDLPMIEAVLVEKRNPGHPYGARGVGEVPIVPVMASVANAVYRATGVRYQALPMSPGNIIAGLTQKDH